jgi:hypothetical protein
MCAVLNKYYSFAHPFSPNWEFWYIREASTAILVANMPMCWPLLRRIFNLKAFNGNSSGAQSRSKSIPFATTYSNRKTNSRNLKNGGGGEDRDGELEVEEGGATAIGGEEWWERNDGRSESEEYIVPSKGKGDVKLQIWESRQVDVESGGVDASDSGRERDLRRDQVRIYDGMGIRGQGEFESTVRIEAGRKGSVTSLRV